MDGVNTQPISMMLNTDFYLYYDIDIDTDGKAMCIPNFNCTMANDTSAIFETYATVSVTGI